jgi:hypothetical protein
MNPPSDDGRAAASSARPGRSRLVILVLAEALLLGRYAKESELKDSWGNFYVYALPGTQGRPFDLTSLGADAKPGGEGRDRDRTWSRTAR